MINIKQITKSSDKKAITRIILEQLPDWFSIEDAREKYISDSENNPFFAAMENDTPVGFLYLAQTSNATVELAVMGVLKEYH